MCHSFTISHPFRHPSKLPGNGHASAEGQSRDHRRGGRELMGGKEKAGAMDHLKGGNLHGISGVISWNLMVILIDFIAF